jgi:hypothetical protein
MQSIFCRQRLTDSVDSLAVDDLIRQFLNMEDVSRLIPVARARNKVQWACVVVHFVYKFNCVPVQVVPALADDSKKETRKRKGKTGAAAADDDDDDDDGDDEVA